MSDGNKGTAETDTTSSWTDSVSATGKEAMLNVEGSIAEAGRVTWKFFHQLPFHGAILGGAVGLGAAMAVGVGELVTAGFTAYVTYRMFAYGESLTEAIENTIKFEKGDLAKEEITKPIPK